MCFRAFSDAPAIARASRPAGAAASRRSRWRSAGSSASPPTSRTTSATACRKPAEKKNGKRIALVGGGPASLAVARDLAPMGYELRRVRPGPEIRRHDAHADSEIPPAGNGDRRGMRLHPQSRHRIPRRQTHRQLQGAARRRFRRHLRRLRRAARPRSRHSRPQGSGEEHPHRHRLAVQRLVRPYRQDRQARHRARRRQYRDGLLPFLAPARRRGRQSHRAFRLRGDEGVSLGRRRTPCTRTSRSSIIWCRRNLPTTTASSPASCSRRSRRCATTRAAATWCRPASRTRLFPCDDVLVAVGQENSFPWIERDCGIEFDKWDMPKVDPATFVSTNPKVFFGGDAAFGPKNIIWAVAHWPRSGDFDRPFLPRRRHQRAAGAA